MQGRIKWLFVLMLTIQLNAQSERVSQFYEYYQKLQRGDTLTFSVPQLRKIYPLLMSLLLTLPINGQVIMMGDKGYTPASDIIPPSIPKGLNGVAVSDDSLLFYWTNPPEGDFVKNYVWFYGALKDSTVNDSIHIGGLLPNKTYGLRVKSRDDKYNYSAYSDSFQVTTLDTVTMPEVPAKPTNLVVTDSLDALTLQFTANGINTSYFDIQRDDLDYDTIDFSTKSVLVTWSETDTTDGVYHEYKVKARNATGSSAYCDSVIAERYTSNTYYVSSGGSNSNSGTNPNLAWQTLSKVNSAWLEDKNVYFKKGETFNGNLTVGNNNVLLASYGTGAIPIIQTYDSIPNWWNAGSWQYQGNNIWTLSLNNIIAPNSRLQRLWINGIEVKVADLCYASYAQSQWLGANYPFYHNDNYLYVYSATNPATTFYSMRYYGRQNTPYTVEISADNVTLDSLDIRGGTFASVGLLGADKAIIRNSNIGKYGIGGIHAHAAWEYSVDDKTSDSVTIKKCTIDSYSENKSLSDCSSGGKQGIYIGSSDNNHNSGSYWLVDSCTIKNYWFGIYVIQDTRYNKLSRYNVISNNEIYNTSDFTAGGKGIQLYSWAITNGDTTNMGMYTQVYNNYIHDLGGSGICIGSNNNYVYYNIIDSIYMGVNGHIMNYATTDDTTDGNGGYGIEIGTEYSSQAPWETLKYNYIFNNTIYKNHMLGVGQSGSDNFIYNNLFLEPYSKPYMPLSGQSSPFVFFGNSGTAIKNNLYIRTGSGINSYIFQLYNGAAPLTTTQLNARTNCSGNVYATQTVVQIMNADFTLPVGSSALNAGIDINALLPNDFKDRNGNTVDQTTPNIGAIDN